VRTSDFVYSFFSRLFLGGFCTPIPQLIWVCPAYRTDRAVGGRARVAVYIAAVTASGGRAVASPGRLLLRCGKLRVGSLAGAVVSCG
jgi:hypothetical protein